MTGDFGFGSMFTMLSTQTEGQFFGFLLLAIFFIIMLTLKRWDFSDVLLVDSLICLLISTMAAFGGFVSWYYALGFAVVLTFGYFGTVFKDKP
jgi:hypothetical protein